MRLGGIPSRHLPSGLEIGYLGAVDAVPWRRHWFCLPRAVWPDLSVPAHLVFTIVSWPRYTGISGETLRRPRVGCGLRSVVTLALLVTDTISYRVVTEYAAPGPPQSEEWGTFTNCEIIETGTQWLCNHQETV